MFDSLFTMMGVTPDQLEKMQSQFETLLSLPQKIDALSNKVDELKGLIENADKK